MSNLLINPGFDDGFYSWNGRSDVVVAQGWLPFWVGRRASDPEWANRQPLFRAALSRGEPSRNRGGSAAQCYATPWATHLAGLMQIVTASPGQSLRLQAFAHSWSTDSEFAGQSADPGQVNLRVGIDPTGGTNPFAASIIWSAERPVYDGYDEGFSVDATSQGERITVFLSSAAHRPRKHNDVFWDDISLEAISDTIAPVPDVVPVSDMAAHIPANSNSATPEMRGRPRTQYGRVYLLLPPSIDEDWLLALVESGVWLNHRWTIGFSADDAGIGALDSRTIIVLNPAAWPDPILPWLEMWYPGVLLNPITAVSAEEFRRLLMTISIEGQPTE